MKKLLEKIEKIGGVARKEIKEMILSQEDQSGTHSSPTEIARELNIDRRSLSRITDQDLDFRSLRKRKVQKLTDSNTEKRKTRSTKLSKYTLIQASDEKILG